jgi:hypothetical protein
MIGIFNWSVKMQVLVKNEENEGLVSLMGKNIEVQTGLFIYAGKLVGVNDICIKLDNAYTVFETGEFKNKKYKDAQARSNPVLYVMVVNIIAFNETTQL